MAENKVSKVIYGNQVLIDLTKDTVAAEKMLKGTTAHDKAGEIITGTCTFDADTTDADATAAEILNTKTAYVNGLKVTGTMPNRGAVTGKISKATDTVTIQSGYHDGSGTISIDATEKAKIIAGNIKNGVELLGVTGAYTGIEDLKIQKKTATPYTDKASTILPDGGYDYLSQVEVAKIKYTETVNPQGGLTVTIGEVAPV